MSDNSGDTEAAGTERKRRSTSESHENDDDDVLKLETEVVLKRRRAAASLTELRRRVDRATSWRQWVARRPLVCFTAIMMLGFVAGSRGKSHR